MPALRLHAFAKINLCLEVLNRRPDGFHNLRTIFQTISLADEIRLEGERARRTSIELTSSVEIPGENLIVRAAHAVLEAMRVNARLLFYLRKRIPMGGGLGGGSTDAAAVLLGLPPLLGRRLPHERLVEIGGRLGSDVPFFLSGGTALGLGRGTEIYPLPDAPAMLGLLVAPPVHVSTAEAYSSLGRTAEVPQGPAVSATEALAYALSVHEPFDTSNDFEQAVFARHPAIAAAKRKLKQLGARNAMMTGSGAAVFGLFESKDARNAAAGAFSGSRTFPFSLVGRLRYRSAWARSLEPLVE